MTIMATDRIVVERKDHGDRIRSGEPDEHGDVWAYPGPNCRGGAACGSCPTFFCTRCRQWRPWCVGLGDEHHPTWCDGCWYAAHRKRGRRRPCRRCTAVVEGPRRRARRRRKPARPTNGATP